MFSPYSLSLPGGVQGQVLGLARELRQRGHQVRVLGPCDGPPPDAGVTPLGNSIPLAANGSVAPIAPDPSAGLRTIRALRDEAFDVIHLHEPLVPGCNMTALLFKACPTVVTFHAAGASASYRYLKPAVRWMATKMDVRAAVSEDAIALARQAIGPDAPVELLWNGVEVRRFAEAEPWADEDDAKGHQTPAILFVGRHEERKGLGVLLEAFSRVTVDAKLWVFGDGPDSAALRAHYTDGRIQWFGRGPDGQRNRLYRGAAVYCAPSLGGESFGVVLLEAMAAGAAVVASDIDGYRNVATESDHALLVPPNDPAALAEALTRVLRDESLRRKLVAGGRRRAEEFSMANLAARYEELYRDAIGVHRATTRSKRRWWRLSL